MKTIELLKTVTIKAKKGYNPFNKVRVLELEPGEVTKQGGSHFIFITPEVCDLLIEDTSPLNRTPDETHVSTMDKSVDLIGVKRRPVLYFDPKTGKLRPADGGHLNKTIKKKGLREQYQLCEEGLDIGLVIRLLNNTIKLWKNQTFINNMRFNESADPKKLHDYNLLNKCIEKYTPTSKELRKIKIQESIVLSVLAWKSRTVATKDLEHGNFFIPDGGIKRAIRTLNQILECRKKFSLPGLRQFNEQLSKIMMMDGYNHVKMIKNLSKHENNMVWGATEREILTALELVYNG